MASGLWEALLHAVGDVTPFGEGEMNLFGVAALLPGDGAQEFDDVLGDVVLYGGAVADRVDVA